MLVVSCAVGRYESAWSEGESVIGHWPGTVKNILLLTLNAQKLGSQQEWLCRTEKAVAEYERSHPGIFDRVREKIQRERRRLAEFHATRPEGFPDVRLDLPDIAYYHVEVGMPKEALRVLYLDPTTVIKKPPVHDVDEVWIYEYEHGTKWMYFIRDDKIVKIVVSRVEWRESL
jgi:hypothetical protein